MALVRKFEFDVSFDVRPSLHQLAQVPAAEALPSPEPEPTFSRDELEAVRDQAHMEGRMAGEAEARGAIEARLVEVTAALAAVIAERAADRQEAVDLIQRRAGAITLLLIRKLVPALIERQGTLEIEALIQSAFVDAADQAKVVVRCSADLRDAVDRLVASAAAQAGFDGKVSVIADPRLTGDDCRVEWADGGVERLPNEMMDSIERAILDGLAAFDASALATSALQENAT